MAQDLDGVINGFRNNQDDFTLAPDTVFAASLRAETPHRVM